jgi:hypothetical protein
VVRNVSALVGVAVLLSLASLAAADLQVLSDHELSEVGGAYTWETCQWDLACPRDCAPTPADNPDGLDPRDYPTYDVIGDHTARACMSPSLGNCQDTKTSVRCGQFRYYTSPACAGLAHPGSYDCNGPACNGTDCP